METVKNDNFFLQAWLVLLLALCYGAALAGVHINFSPIIKENKINETRQKVPELILSEKKARQLAEAEQSLQSQRLRITVKADGRQKSYNVFKAIQNETVRGWVAKAAGQGYADEIELLIGLSPEAERITGLFVLSQKETPGLGANIVNKEWRQQFAVQTTARKVRVVKDGADEPHEVDAITGATISSRAVCSIVNSTVADLKTKLAEGLDKSGGNPANQTK